VRRPTARRREATLTEEVSIRGAGREDAAGVLAVYAPIVRDTAISFEEEPPSVDEMAGRIAKSHLWLVAELDGEVAGYAYAGPFHARSAYRWSVEVSVYLGPEARGRGIGKRLLGVLLDRLREMGFVNAFGGVALPNDASVGLFESLGFERIAHWDKAGFKHDAWHDVDWWQLRLRDPTVPPPPLGGAAS
jgi:phosphinothricin acetyltransferase